MIRREVNAFVGVGIALTFACGPSTTEPASGGSGTGSMSAGSSSGVVSDVSSLGTASTGSAVTTDSDETASSSSGDTSAGGGTPECPMLHDGDLIVTEETDVEALRGIHRVKGSVSVSLTTLQNLDFLDCLSRVDGSIYIGENAELTSVSGLGNLDPTSSEITIRVVENASLVGLDGLDSIQSLYGLEVARNALLEDLGLNGLVDLQFLSLGFCYVDEGEVEAYYDNPSLTSITGLSSLTNVYGVEIAGQLSLTSIERLQGLAEIGTVGGGSAKFANNSQLPYEDIAAFLETAGLVGLHCGNQGDPVMRCTYNECPEGE